MTDKYNINYFRDNDKYSFIRVFRTGLTHKEIKRRGITPFIFMARIGLNGELLKYYFKTMKQAIDYSKKYARINHFKRQK